MEHVLNCLKHGPWKMREIKGGGIYGFIFRLYGDWHCQIYEVDRPVLSWYNILLLWTL